MTQGYAFAGASANDARLTRRGARRSLPRAVSRSLSGAGSSPSEDASATDDGAPRFVVVDAANCIYRAFFALPPLRNSAGLPTNAVLGFANMLAKVVREERPDYLVIVFDARGKSFRHEIYPEYKATRDAQPEDLSAQVPLVRELVEAQRIPVLEVEGVEADDVIATLATRAPADWRITIVSTDKDLMQLVSERVALLDTMKDLRYRPAEVEARFGVTPERVLELRALVGDPSDNIPGVRGIGEKGAAKLLGDWGSLEEVLAHRDEIKNKRTREALHEQAEQARLSRRLAALRHDVALPVAPEALRRREPDRERLAALLRRLEFTRLLQELETGAAPPAARARVETEIVADEAALAGLRARLARQDRVVAIPVGGGESVLRDEPVGLAFALDGARAAYLPLRPAAPAAAPGVDAVVAGLRDLLGGEGAPAWGGREVKALQIWLGERGFEPPLPCGDAEIAAFLIDPAAQRGSVALASRLLGRTLRPWQELTGKGARARPARELELEQVAGWAGEEVCAVRELLPRLEERLAADGLASLYREVELPLTAVLARMERAGVRVDEDVLGRLSQEYERELVRLEGEIHALAGEPFLIGSPKQLQRILFEKLKLPVVRKTKTGFSTDESVLETLASHHELPARVLAHRRLAKLKSTYVDALPPLVDPKSGRIHPCFHQTGAATGRLSASSPNVQNIPIRTEEGVRIREAFVPAEGAVLVSADYSQVELRILAHYSGDESLIEAFRADEDIHRRTAAEVLGLAPADVTADQRARAKAVNFGILYGSTSYGIANQLGIASADAQAMIDAYFERYRGVRRFLDETIASARKQGFVCTLLGRRRYLPDLGSRNRVLRSAAERMAVNSVIQGTAADLIKKAMVSIDDALRRSAARMILQVHDELVLEAPAREAEAVGALVRERMEGVWQLRVPLRVQVGTGKSWREAH